jgi:hypothetical protein
MKENIKKFKYTFDKITSQNSTNWQLLLFWLIVVELVASIIEYIYADKMEDITETIPHTIYTEIAVALLVTAYVGFFIYNIINATQRTVMKFMFFSAVGLYFIITNDFTLNFLMQNLNPLHFFDFDFGFVFFVELFFKLLMTYLVYQLIVTIKNKE